MEIQDNSIPRNIITATGVLFAAFLPLFKMFNEYFNLNSTWYPSAAIFMGIVFLILAVLLIICGKRSITAASFIVLAFVCCITAFEPDYKSYWALTAPAVLIVFALVFSLSKDNIKYALISFFFLEGFAELIHFGTSYYGNVGQISVILHGLAAVGALYCSIALNSDKYEFPGREYLSTDNADTFAQWGSTIAFLLLSLPSIWYAIKYLQIEEIPLELIPAEFLALIGLIQIYLGLILIFLCRESESGQLIVSIGIIWYMGSCIFEFTMMYALSIICFAYALILIVRTSIKHAAVPIFLIVGIQAFILAAGFECYTLLAALGIITAVICFYTALALCVKNKPLTLF